MAGLNIQPTDTALFINGLFFDLEAIDVLTLLESLRSELRVMEALHKIGTRVTYLYISVKYLINMSPNQGLYIFTNYYRL